MDRVTIDHGTSEPALRNQLEDYWYFLTPKDSSIKNTSGDTWPVDWVVKHRRKRYQLFGCLVPWSGEHTPTWEPRGNIMEEFISRYFDGKKNTRAHDAPIARVG